MTKIATKFLFLLLAFALVAAACGSSSTDDPETTAPTEAPTDDPAVEGDPSPEDDPAPEDEPAPQDDPDASGGGETMAPPPVDPADLFDSAPGVTADTILIGYPIIDFDGLNQNFNLGLQYENYTPVIDAWVADFNAKGGVNGRMLEVLVEPYIPSQIFAAQAEEVCLRLTEDTQVFVVMEGFNGIPAASNCIIDLHETMIVGSPILPEQLATARAPWITDEMMHDRQARVFIQLMSEAGLFAEEGVDKVYVISPNDSYDLVKDDIAAAYEAAGIEVPLSITLQNSGQEDQALEEMNVILERARTEGVTWLHIVSNMPLALPAIFETNGEFNMLFSDNSSTAAWGYDKPPTLVSPTKIYRLANMENKTDYGMAECVAIAEGAIGAEVKTPAELTPDETNWWPGVTNVCRNLGLFAQVAAWAGADLNKDTFAQAFADHGSDLIIPGVQYNSLSADKVDANDTVRIELFDPDGTVWNPVVGDGEFVNVGGIR